MPSDYEVIVVGAGPAGLSTAKTLALKGRRCLVIDKATEIGLPVRTSGASWIDEMTRLGIPKKCFNPVSRISLIGPTKDANFNFQEPTTCILDVTEVNRFLASQATKNGAELRLGCEATNLITSEGFIKGVEIKDSGKIEKLTSKVVVDATGLNAALVRKIGYLDYWRRIGLGIQYDVESTEIDPDWVGLYMGNQFIPSGYGWFFPWKKNRARIGLGIIRPDSYQNPLKYMEKFLKNKKVPKNESFKVLTREVGVFPCTGPLENSVANGFLAVGDSVGQGSPLHGEGIRYAIEFGEVAGNTIAKAIEKGVVTAENLGPYERSWKKAETKNFKVALAIQKRISKYGDEQWDKGIEYLSQIGTRDPKLIVQLFKTDFSSRNMWRVFKQSPLKAAKYVARSI